MALWYIYTSWQCCNYINYNGGQLFHYHANNLLVALRPMQYTYTVESRNYTPPFVHASIGQNRGGVYSWDSDIYM